MIYLIPVTCTLMLAQIMPVNKTPFHACKNGSEENSVITCLHAHGLNFYYNLLQEGVDELVGVQEAVEASLEALEHHGEQEGVPGPVPQQQSDDGHTLLLDLPMYMYRHVHLCTYVGCVH